MSAQTPGMDVLAQGVQNAQPSDNSMPVVQSSKSSSTPGTPRSKIDTSASTQASPSLQRRSSGQTHRPGSSASPKLVRTTSRSSVGSSPIPHDPVRRPTPKRSISNLITELRGAQATMEAIAEPVILTAPDIAVEYFKKELAKHDEANSETVVLLHNACYGHRFSRLKSSKGALSMIVERPERILASVLGIATSYVRSGGHHVGGRNAPRPNGDSQGRPPFTIKRSSRNIDIKSTYVTNVHGFEWMTELDTMCNKAGEKLAACEKEVARLPSTSGEDKRTLHEGDLYLCEESLGAFQGALGGVADAVDAVFNPATSASRAFVAVRPPGHHCSADYPSGFCWINNVHVGIEYAAQTYDLTHAAIIDFDLHHGDGSQTITWQRNSKNHMKRLYPKSFTKTRMAPDIGYYSLHDINSYPCEMGDDDKVQAASLCVHNAHGQSIWNVHLQPWKTSDEFWSLYENEYSVLLKKATEFLRLQTARIISEGKQKPKAAIFISAGFDASEWEGEGMQRHKVNVPTEFYARLTSDIVKVAQDVNTSCNGRVISVLEGGYSDRALCSSTISHLSGLCSPKQQQQSTVVAPSFPVRSGLDQQMQQLSLAQPGYETSWWSANNLQALEDHVNPAPASAGGKKARAGPHPTYATPTESFAYKVIDPAKFARSVSGTFRDGTPPARPITPPPPEVDWIVAAHELSRLLIPSDRSTRSHTAEDLLGPKIKKERPGSADAISSPDGAGKPRQLRTRGKAVAQTPNPTRTRNVSGGDRRKTMGDFVSVLAEAAPTKITSRRPSRRSSMASTVSDVSTLPDPTAPPVPAMPIRSAGATGAGAGLEVKKNRATSTATPAKPKKTLNIGTNSLPPGEPKLTPVDGIARTNGTITPDVMSPDANMDNLASGMKRVTIKVGSKEESERKAKEKLDADRRARALKAAETRRVNKAAKEAKAAQEKADAMATSTEHVVPCTAVPPVQNVPAMMQQNHPAPTYQHNPYNATAHQGTPAPSTQQAVYTSMRQPTGPAPSFEQSAYTSAERPYEAASNLPMRTPSANASQYYQHGVPIQHLPVFQSTGHIPFANNLAQQQPQQQQWQQQQPMPQGLEHGLYYPPDIADDQIMTNSASYAAVDGQPIHEYDVWAIPDTPAKQLYDPQR